MGINRENSKLTIRILFLGALITFLPTIKFHANILTIKITGWNIFGKSF